jgi:hypothetical protein
MGHICVKMARADLGQLPNSRFRVEAQVKRVSEDDEPVGWR